MRPHLALLVLVLCGWPAALVEAGAAVIELYELAFLPQTVSIQVGETVTWLWIEGSHTITSGLPDGEVGTPDEPGLLFSEVVDQANPSFSYTFNDPGDGTYNFFDADNPIQIGTIEIESDAQTFDVAVVDNVFEPDVLYIFEGDSVRWVHEPGEAYHTVTSGLSSDPADHPGELFDEDSSDDHPIFIYPFVDAGEYPYFCRPHEFLGMTGVIHVQDRFIRADANRDGTVGIADPIATLDYLFGGVPTNCLDALDANDDGSVDLGDAIYGLTYVFTGGEPPPLPFPAAGPDRTEDGLHCWE